MPRALTDAQLRATPIDVAVVSGGGTGGGGGGTEYTEDAASAANPAGGILIARRRDALSTETTTDGDNTALNSTAKGELYVKHADAIGVTGTFWQATQPVSISGTVPVSGALTDAQLRAAAVPVSGTFWQATQPVSGPLTDAQLRAADLNVRVKDDGRVRCCIKFQNTSAVAETLLSVVKQLAGVDAAGATSIGVTAGKRLRITSVAYTLKANAAAAAFATLHIRSNPAGATVIGSPSILRAELGLTAATIGSALSYDLAIPDGIEFSGAETLGITLACQATTNIHSISLIGFEYTP
jgi:hypothetical protein